MKEILNLFIKIRFWFKYESFKYCMLTSNNRMKRCTHRHIYTLKDDRFDSPIVFYLLLLFTCSKNMAGLGYKTSASSLAYPERASRRTKRQPWRWRSRGRSSRRHRGLRGQHHLRLSSHQRD